MSKPGPLSLPSSSTRTWSRVAAPPSASFASSTTTERSDARGPGLFPYTCVSNSLWISARRRRQASGLATSRPSSKRSGSGSVYAGTLASSYCAFGGWAAPGAGVTKATSKRLRSGVIHPPCRMP